MRSSPSSASLAICDADIVGLAGGGTGLDGWDIRHARVRSNWLAVHDRSHRPAPPKIRWPRRRRSAISVPATSYTRCSGVGDALSGPGGGVTPVAELVGKA